MVRVVKKPEERKSEIIATACDLFLSKGYEKTTMKDVMRHLGIAKGTIYHYFNSKEELLEAVINSVAESEMLRLKMVVENLKGNALERLEQLILNGSNHGADDGHEEILDNLHKNSNAGMHIRLLAKVVTMQAPLYAEQFQLGCEEGVFQTDHPLECAEFLLSGIQFLTDMGIYPWTQEQLERRWKAFPKIIENQLNAPDGSFSFLLKIVPENK
ncbi:TetR/AcrR family transcriptional regulator [Desulfopila sp. IMCC35008]|uniref:TetR/AcrR family transcriptional regulator n=1 Tax=Desulfopila sp. IMCC35008 TaxID=2653858 RepID=UPI0013D6135D|nr:TetR/AcrR family transcriptional regulator [Desulfopila sp. IMCC35008]